MARVDCKVEDCQFCTEEGCCTNPNRLELAEEDCICLDCQECNHFTPL